MVFTKVVAESGGPARTVNAAESVLTNYPRVSLLQLSRSVRAAGSPPLTTSLRFLTAPRFVVQLVQTRGPDYVPHSPAQKGQGANPDHR